VSGLALRLAMTLVMPMFSDGTVVNAMAHASSEISKNSENAEAGGEKMFFRPQKNTGRAGIKIVAFTDEP